MKIITQDVISGLTLFFIAITLAAFIGAVKAIYKNKIQRAIANIHLYYLSLLLIFITLNINLDLAAVAIIILASFFVIEALAFIAKLVRKR